MTTTMTAAELVKLAKRAAHECPRDADSTEGADLAIIYFEATGQVSPWALAMRVTFAPENTASESALTRALLASAVTYKHFPSPPEDRPFAECWLGDRFAPGWTEAEARDALLDALLAPSGEN